MASHDRLLSLVVLIAIGAGWGITEPLTKLATSTGHRFFGLIFWQLAIGSVVMALICWLRGLTLRLDGRALRVYLLIALMGTVVPNSASYETITHIPAGVMAILMSLIPMAAFPIALALGLERFAALRLAGLAAGLAGVLLLVLPDASLPDPSMIVWVPLGLVSVLCYAFEGNYVARWGTEGLDPAQVMLGASVTGAIIVWPLAQLSGHYINPLAAWGVAEWSLVAASVVHVTVYAAYVWLVGRAGAVFAVQVSYLVTCFGVFWSMLILGERYSGYIWGAFGLVLAGLYLVQPRVAEPGRMEDTRV